MIFRLETSRLSPHNWLLCRDFSTEKARTTGGRLLLAGPATQEGATNMRTLRAPRDV